MYKNFNRLLAFLIFGFCASSYVNAQEKVCSKVKIEISQQLTLERQAFEATMTINNGLNVSLTSIDIDVNFADKDGNPITATADSSQVENPDGGTPQFFIRVLSKDGVDDVDGAGSIAPGTEAVIKWLIIPTKNAGGQDLNGVEYKIGASLGYNDNTGPQTVDVIPDSIFVYPMPDLKLDYFLPEYVYGDDPDTGFVESPEPFHLGFRVLNIGFGTAKALKLKTDQPRIVENNQGMLAGFSITGSEVNGQAATKSLIADIGDISPGKSGIVNWVMEATMSGQFQDFTASFTHDDDLGGELTSLIDQGNINTHTLVHEVLVDLPGRDTLRDFLALDGNNFNIYESDGQDNPVTNTVGNAVAYGGGQINISRPRLASIGFHYLKFQLTGDEAALDNLQVNNVLRNDGKQISTNNAWIFKKKNGENWEYFVNIFDFDSTTAGGDVSYQIGMGQKPLEIKPILQQIANRVVTLNTFLGIEVQSSVQGLPEEEAALSMKSLLATNAAFEQIEDGKGRFEWTPNKVGNYTFTIYAAHDGKRVNRSFTISVVDGTTPSVEFALDEMTIDESQGTAEIFAKLSTPTNQTVSVNYNVVEGSALGAGVDFNLTSSGTITFDPGELQKSVTIFLNNDEEAEGTEDLELILTGPINSFLGATNKTKIDIIDDDLNDGLLISDGNVVKRFDSTSGEFVDEFISYFSLEDIGQTLYMPDGKILISSKRYESLYLFDGLTGQLVKEFSGIAELGAVNKFLLAYDGRLLVQNDSKVIALNATDGSFIEDVLSASVDEQFLNITQDKEGNLVVLLNGPSGSSLKAFATDGSEIADYFQSMPPLTDPSFMAFAADGSLLISYKSSDKIIKYERGVGGIEFSDASTLLVEPEEFTFDSEGNLIIAVKSAELQSLVKLDLTDSSIVANNLAGAQLIDIRNLSYAGISPTILSQPIGGNVIPGSTMTFEVAALGTQALTYQWQKDGVDISEETSPILSIEMDVNTESATYQCVVTNYMGFVTSDPALLTKGTNLIGLSSGDTFTLEDIELNWNDVGAAEYQVLVGTSAGASDIESHTGLNTTSLILSNLTFNGGNIFLRLRSFNNGEYSNTDYQFTTEVINHTVTFVASDNGQITGTNPQSVIDGGSSTLVTAVPNTGYDFTGWDNGVLTADISLDDIRGDLTVIANFAIKVLTVTFDDDGNGSIQGNRDQQVNYGSDTEVVTAMPIEGYEFIKWSDGNTDNPRTLLAVTVDTDLIAEFSVKEYSVNFTAGVNGSLNGDAIQTVDHGANSSAVVAVADEGYHFVQWSDTNTDNPRIFTNVSENKSVTALFAINEYSVTFNQGAFGTLTGDSIQTIDHGSDSSSVSINPGEGYRFTQWSDGNTDNPRSFTNVIENKSVTAQYALIQYNVSFTVVGNGTITGDSVQVINHGANSTSVTAVPDAGYYFVKWSDNDTNATKTISDVQADISLSAEFAINEYVVTFVAGANGTIVGETPQTIDHGSPTVSVTATPDEGYYFVQWQDGDTNATRVIASVESDQTHTAEFAINEYVVTFVAGKNGTITGETPQTIDHGSPTVSVTATADEGYHFVQWQDGDTNATRVIASVESAQTHTATFAINEYVVTFVAGANGAIVGDTPQTIDHGSPTLSITATADDGYHFVQWQDGDTNATRLIASVESAQTHTATFAINEYVVTFVAGQNGSITGDTPQTINHGSPSISVTATPAVGYHFVQWQDGDTNATRIIASVESDQTHTAEFAINEYVVTFVAGANGSITGDTPQTIDHGSPTVSVTAKPDEGYHFVQWQDGDTNATRVIASVESAQTHTATFAINEYVVTFVAGANGSITGDTPQTIEHGSPTLSVTATADEGYHFVQWQDGDTNPVRVIANVESAQTHTATFAINEYVVTFVAGQNGSITGDTPQIIEHGSPTLSVTATADAGYHFVQWQDGDTNPTRVVASVESAQTHTATFAINEYVVTFVAGQNGSITGDTPQTIDHGSPTVSVTATADEGYHFVQWQDGDTNATRIIASVESDQTHTAEFAINEYVVTFVAGENGTITGETPQTINHGSPSISVTATPALGYHFVQWDDGDTNATRVIASVEADVTLTAEFEINEYSVNFVADVNGTIEGFTTQTIEHGGSTTSVAAKANAGYRFVQWDDGDTNLVRTLTDVQDDVTLVATFEVEIFIVNYTAGANGTIDGEWPQGLEAGVIAGPVTASPVENYIFKQWSDGNIDNPRSITVSQDVTLVAEFEELPKYTIDVSADANGTIDGEFPITRYVGEVTYPVTAIPNAGYIFKQWSDGNTENPRIFTFDQDKSIIAEFELDNVLRVEFGQASVSSDWQTINLTKSFIDPVVVLGPPTDNEVDPVTVRIRNKTATSFEVRLQDWDYLVQTHVAESISYMVVERGSHTLANGKVLEANSVDLTNATYADINFSNFMSSSPIVLSTVASVNEASAVTTRVRNVNGNSFQIKIQKEEFNGSNHATESVDWIAIEGGIVTVDGYDLNVKTVSPVDERNKVVDLEDYSMLVGNTHTVAGGDTGSLRMSDNGDGTVNLRFEEEQSREAEVAHANETAGVILVRTAKPPITFDYGVVSVDHNWLAVPFAKTFIDPIVVVSPPTNNDADFAVARVRNVTASGFEVRVQEWDYLDQAHAAEDIHYFVIERGRHMLPGGQEIEAGSTTIENSAFATVNLSKAMSTAPVLLSSVVSENQLSAVTRRVRNINSSSFQVRLQEQDISDQIHATESIHFIAFDKGGFTYEGFDLLAGTVTPVDERVKDLGISGYDGFIASDHTFAGSDNGALRMQGNPATGVQLIFEEEQSKDNELGHANETAGYLFIRPHLEEPIDVPEMEIGNVSVDSAWQTVNLTGAYSDPVVITGPAGSVDTDPVTVRLRNITATSFEIRLQEYDYQDDIHQFEQVSYFVVERGSYNLSGGIKLVAESTSLSNSSFSTISLPGGFTSTPVVMASITSENDLSAVVTRTRNVSSADFQIRLQEEELNDQTHASETVNYIAVEKGSLTVGDYELSISTSVPVDEILRTIGIAGNTFFIADDQTQAGGDTAEVRMRGDISAGPQVYIEEEQSKNDELIHANETIGFIFAKLTEEAVQSQALAAQATAQQASLIPEDGGEGASDPDSSTSDPDGSGGGSSDPNQILALNAVFIFEVLTESGEVVLVYVEQGVVDVTEVIDQLTVHYTVEDPLRPSLQDEIVLLIETMGYTVEMISLQEL